MVTISECEQKTDAQLVSLSLDNQEYEKIRDSADELCSKIIRNEPV